MNMSSVEDYMSTRLVIRGLKSSVFELAKVMVDSNVSSVAIMEQEDAEQQQSNKRVIGILTERDIIKSIAKGVPLDDITAGSSMSSSPLLSVRKDQSIEEAALLMIKNRVRHLLIEDPDQQNSVIGIITTTDLARYLRKRMKESTIAAAATEANKEQTGQEIQEQSSPVSSDRLLSEAWELYF